MTKSSPGSSLREIALNFARDNASPRKGMWLAELWDTANVDEVTAVAASFGIPVTYTKPVFVDGSPCRLGAMSRKASMVYQLLVEAFDQGIYAALGIEQLADRLNLPVEDACLELEWLQDWEFVMSIPDKQTFTAILYGV